MAQKHYQLFLSFCLLLVLQVHLPMSVMSTQVNNYTYNVTCNVSDLRYNNAMVTCSSNATLPFNNNSGCLQVCLTCTLTFNMTCGNTCCSDSHYSQPVICHINPTYSGCGSHGNNSECFAVISVYDFGNAEKNASLYYNAMTPFNTDAIPVTIDNSIKFEDANPSICPTMESSNTSLGPITSTTMVSITSTVSLMSTTTTTTTMTNTALDSETTMKMTTVIMGVTSLSPSSQSFLPSSTVSIVISSTSEPSTSQPYLFIVIGAFGGIFIIFVVGLLICCCCCCILYIRRQRKKQVIFELRNRTSSHNYVTTGDGIITTKIIDSSGNAMTSRPDQIQAADLSLTTAATFPRTIAQRPLPPDPSRERPTSDITLTQTGQTDTLWNNSHNGVKETGLLSTSRFGHWKSVFSSMLIQKNNLTVNNEEPLGEGAFGKVIKGSLKVMHEAKTKEVEVAVKTLRENPSTKEIEEFISESAIMLDFDHPNVLRLLGVCFDTEDQLPIIVLPYMANGDLKSFLRDKRKHSNVQYNVFPKGLTHTKLMYMCLDIARGMEYLASKKFVHRDLAARNCVVDKDLSVRVSDFGLSRDVYSRDYYRMGLKAAKLPVKWMPLESLNYNMYNEKTDVWSFGVTCWEIFSLGRSPYPTIDNAEVIDYIEKGDRLKKPALCEDKMYEIMTSCWLLEPEDRAAFKDIVHSLCVLLREANDDQDSDNEGPSNDYFMLEENSAQIAEVIMKKEQHIEETRRISLRNSENSHVKSKDLPGQIDFHQDMMSPDLLSPQPYTEPQMDPPNTNTNFNNLELDLSQDIAEAHPYTLPSSTDQTTLTFTWAVTSSHPS